MNKEIFKIRKLNEEGTLWGVSVGNHLVSSKRFKTEEEAHKYQSWLTKKLPWEEVISVIAEIINLNSTEK